MYVYDALDRRLIAVLREDGRAPISKLAEILGVSRATVQTRLDRLVANGAVLGFTIRAREEHDSGVRAVMMIAVHGKATSAVIRALRGLPELRHLHATNGKWDLVAEVTAEDLPSFDRLLRQVRDVDGITNSETSILLSSV